MTDRQKESSDDKQSWVNSKIRLFTDFEAMFCVKTA